MSLKLADIKKIYGEPINGVHPQNQQFEAVVHDSRSVKANSVFVCIKGEKNDGHDFIDKAILNGASVIIAEENSRQKALIAVDSSASLFIVPKGRFALSELSHILHNNPTKDIKLIGVTGTNGKTTVTHLIAQIISKHFSCKVGIIGTLGGKLFENGSFLKTLDFGSGRTTPEADELCLCFKEFINEGCEFVTMEVSSHSLEQGRVHGCRFDVAVMTNLTQDHLDYHITMENYFLAKALLFQNLSQSQKATFAVINLNSDWATRFIEEIPKETNLITYGVEQAKAKINAIDVSLAIDLIKAKIEGAYGEGELKLPLKGMFNLSNALAALGACSALQVPLGESLRILLDVQTAPGRFQVVNKPFSGLPTCIVDYAHTPDGLENVLKTAKELLVSGGRLISVFGCGGDRDTTKRPIMGRISEQYADFTIITSDNPRTEDPHQIVSDIISGMQSTENVFVEINRAVAIEKAIREAKPDDIVLIAGKGHENYQIFANETIHFDDLEEVEKVFNKLTKTADKS